MLLLSTPTIAIYYYYTLNSPKAAYLTIQYWRLSSCSCCCHLPGPGSPIWLEMTPGRPHHIQLRAKKSDQRPLDIGRPLYAWKQGDHFPEHIKFPVFSSGDSNTAFDK